jgi:hypothetical protein
MTSILRKPKTFHDKEGHVWDVSLDLGLCEDIDKSDFSLYLPTEIVKGDNGDMQQVKRKELVLLKGERSDITLIMSDTSLLFAVVWVIVQEQCSVNGITAATEDERQRQFVRLMNGTAAEEAREAFVESLGDFFPAARIALSKLWSTMKQSTEKINSRLAMVDSQVSQMLDKKLDQAMQEFQETLSKA